MSMQDEMVWVIKKDGLFVNPKFRALFSGYTSGFTFYNNEETAKDKLDKLGGLNDGYYIEYINLKNIPKGKRIYDD